MVQKDDSAKLWFSVVLARTERIMNAIKLKLKAFQYR